MYIYKAEVVKVVDGDTIDCVVDLGFHMKAEIRFRLARINTPEVRGIEKEEGVASKQWLIDRLNAANNTVTIKTAKTGKYGRWLAEIFIDEININDELVKNELAKYVDY